jgi:CDGSH-type Zn-finger protein
MVDKAKVKVTKDGPYIIFGNIPLSNMSIEPDSYGEACRWRDVKKFPRKEIYSLCRCGKSENKPFCDGTHSKIQFDGTETFRNESYLDNVKEFVGPELRLTDKKELCVDAEFCVRGANIWNLTVHSDRPGFRETAIEEAINCPSGRLVVWDLNHNPIEPEFEPSIVVTEHMNGSPGPLWIRGKIEIESAEGTIYEKRNRVTLCNCGKSENKPLCDGSHLF